MLRSLFKKKKRNYIENVMVIFLEKKYKKCYGRFSRKKNQIGNIPITFQQNKNKSYRKYIDHLLSKSKNKSCRKS